MNKKLYDALRELVKDGDSFNFEFTPVPKGIEINIAKGLDENMESELKDWITGGLASASNYNNTRYELTFNDSQIHLDCNAYWGSWPDEGLNSIHDLLTEGILNILLPKYDFHDIDLDCLSISFECVIEESKIEFIWSDETATYYDDDKGIDIEIPIKPIKKALETEFKKFIPHFAASGYIDREGSIEKIVSVDESHPSVSESMNFQLTYSLEDLEDD